MDYLAAYKEAFENYLESEKFENKPEGLYQPINYILSLGGKRIRPLLLLMGHELYDIHFERALPAAFAVEMFHNFSLVHDDIMDKALLRRGKPTVHTKYGDDTAILSGDVMMVYAYHFLSKIDDPLLQVKVTNVFTKMAIQVCEGQQMDMDFEKREDVTIEEYISMITFKTSVLIAAAFQIGAIIGGADDDDGLHLYQFGKNIGIAFQIQDDLLDAYGNEATVGKRIGGDILNNKKTYLYLKAYALLGSEERKILAHLFKSDRGDEDEKLSKVMAFFKETNVKEYAIQLMEAYRDLAFSHIDALHLDTTKKENLKAFGNYFLTRSV